VTARAAPTAVRNAAALPHDTASAVTAIAAMIHAATLAAVTFAARHVAV